MLYVLPYRSFGFISTCKILEALEANEATEARNSYLRGVLTPGIVLSLLLYVVMNELEP